MSQIFSATFFEMKASTTLHNQLLVYKNRSMVESESSPVDGGPSSKTMRAGDWEHTYLVHLVEYVSGQCFTYAAAS